MTLEQTTLGGVRKVLMNCLSFHLLHVFVFRFRPLNNYTNLVENVNQKCSRRIYDAFDSAATSSSVGIASLFKSAKR